MIKAKQAFFWTCKSRGYGFHGNKAAILYLISKYYSLCVLSAKLYFLEIDPVHQKLWSFKCMVLKTLNSNFLEWEDTLNQWLLLVNFIGFISPELAGKLLDFVGVTDFFYEIQKTYLLKLTFITVG